VPTKHPQIKVTVTIAELARLHRDSKGESDSNLVRRKLKLKPLIQGARKGNKNAAKAGFEIE
jgi:hypothetical protein